MLAKLDILFYYYEMPEYLFETTRPTGAIPSTMLRLDTHPSGIILPNGLIRVTFHELDPTTETGLYLPSPQEVAGFSQQLEIDDRAVDSLSFTEIHFNAFAARSLAMCQEILKNHGIKTAVLQANIENDSSPEAKLVQQLGAVLQGHEIEPGDDSRLHTGLYL